MRAITEILFLLYNYPLRKKRAMKRKELENYLNTSFNTELFDDYCPNGLQVEGSDEIKKVLFALSATRESCEHAAKIKAHALIVHHGLFWKFHGTKTLTGPFYKRVSPLIKNDINLFGYHLPLDSHLEFGNAKTIADKIDLINLLPFGNHKGAPTGVKGEFKTPLSAAQLTKKLKDVLNHEIYYSNPIDEKDNLIKTMGIITGGANSEWRDAKKHGLDAYLTGEMSEHDYHESRESNIHMFAGGHHATEKLGIIALMEHLKAKFPELECSYLESENPA